MALCPAPSPSSPPLWMAIIERSVSVRCSMGFSVCDVVQRWSHVPTRPSAVSLRPRLSIQTSSTAATPSHTSFISSRKLTRPMSIITHEAMQTSTADEVWAGKMTSAETATGIRMGHVPSRQMRRCSRDERHVQNFHVGTMRILSIFDCRPASCRARNSTVATFSASEGCRSKNPRGIQRAAPLVVRPMK